MPMIVFTVPGKPKAWQRPGRNPKTGKRFTPKATLNYCSAIRSMGVAALADVTGRIPLQCEVAVIVQLYVADRRKRDIDNMAKAILDGLQTRGREWGVIADDSQVVALDMRRIVIDKENPRAEIAVVWEDDNAR